MGLFDFNSGGRGLAAPASAPAPAAPIAVSSLQSKADPEVHEALKEWLRANEVALAERVLADDDNLSHHALAVYPAVKGGCLAQGVGCFAEGKEPDTVFVLGDTHGDFDTFFEILKLIVVNCPSPTVYLLGDVVDRNGEGCMLECAMILAILQKALPADFAQFNNIRLGIVKGDHDVGLLYAEPYAPETRFRAMVSPADYCDWLNKRLDDGADESATKIGRAWIRLMKECPAAVFLERSGTLLSHGGVPRKDIQEGIAKGRPYLVQSEASSVDYAWCRMATAKNKLLNRGSKTSEIGGVEFDSFCKTVFPSDDPSGRGTRVRRFVFGHQHPVKGFEQYIKWYEGYEACCIASFRSDEVFGGPTLPHFCQIESARKEVGEDGNPVERPEAFKVNCLNLVMQKEVEQAAAESPDSADAGVKPVSSDPKPAEASPVSMPETKPVEPPAAEGVTPLQP